MAIGDYPAEYNAKVHGPYDPARFYGKPDTPFGQVRLGEIGSWLSRRNKHPSAVAGAISRGNTSIMKYAKRISDLNCVEFYFSMVEMAT
ncbi:atp synthase f chain mitochondrial-related [Holotrichia oblita]|uniref:Atp synthase f chain mitochondrial-related n=1 Tax=Holotrichia oblita TaxID=644536 RepID=A0ACB9SNV8_HOLOL|nr:atp synthase f chain mitochondrial-related [Holotrichia oblita]